MRATSPCRGSRTRNSTNERFGIKDSARERHGLFRCGAFGAACVAVHRSNIREWHPPGPNSHSTFYSVIRFRLLTPDPHCLTLCHSFATYRRISHSFASTICRCITVRSVWFSPLVEPESGSLANHTRRRFDQHESGAARRRRFVFLCSQMALRSGRLEMLL